MTDRRVIQPVPTALLLLVGLLAAAPVHAQGPPSAVEYYHLDALGSVRVVTNQAGAVVSRHDVMPFGEEWQPVTLGREALLFTGQERDYDTGLDYFGARYLTAGWGRFTTVDPVQTTADNLVDPQRWSRYAYVRNNPLKYVDPTGMYLVGCDASEKACAKQMKKFEDLRQRALKSKDSSVRTAAERLGAPGEKGPTVTPDFGGKLQGAEGAYDSETDTIFFRPGLGGIEGVRTVAHEGSHYTDAVLARGKPEFEDWQVSRWESEIRAFDTGARVFPYDVGGGIVLKPGNRTAIEKYLRSVPRYVNQGPYPLVMKPIW